MIHKIQAAVPGDPMLRGRCWRK